MSRTILAFTMTRHMRAPRPRRSADSFSRSATAWPRPMRQHRPFLGRAPSATGRDLRRGRDEVSRLPLACPRKERGRRLAELPWSRMRPDCMRNSVLSSLVMSASLRLRAKQSSKICRTSHHGAEMLAVFGEAHIARSHPKRRSPCANPVCRHIFRAGRREHTLCASILPSNGRDLPHLADTQPNARRPTKSCDRRSI